MFMKRLDDLPEVPDDTVFWRYMSFAQLLDVVHRSKLWLARLDQLEDRYEGTTSQATFDGIREDNPDTASDLIAIHARCDESIRLSTYVNCWHASSGESMAMWKIYGGRNQGVAVKTTAANLKRALQPDRRNIGMAYVRYEDYAVRRFGENSDAQRAVSKQSAYAFEQEVRVIMVQTDRLHKLMAGSGNLPKDFPTGASVDVLPQEFIETVYVSPFSDLWFSNIVASVLRKYGCQHVQRSLLNDRPYEIVQ